MSRDHFHIKKKLYWSIVDLQCCTRLRWTASQRKTNILWLPVCEILKKKSTRELIYKAEIEL